MTRPSVTNIETLLSHDSKVERLLATHSSRLVQQLRAREELRYNDAPLSTSTTSNWVARHGGLPPFVRAIVRGIMRSGKTEAAAIGDAIVAVKQWAAGGGNVHPSTRARAAAAVAHWEAMKAATGLTRSDDEFIEYLLDHDAHATPNKRTQAERILERRC